MHLFVTAENYEKLNAHAAKCWPEEACALLVGRRENTECGAVSRIVLSKNIAADPLHFFEIDPAIRIMLEKELRTSSDELVGVFHTHPNGQAVPSSTDETMTYEKQLSWLIAASDSQGIQKIEAYHPRQDSGFDKATFAIEKNESAEDE